MHQEWPDFVLACRGPGATRKFRWCERGDSNPHTISGVRT